MWEAFMKLDGNILLWVQDYIRNDILTQIMKFITHLGDRGYVWIGILLLFLFFAKMRKVGILMIFSLLGSLLINNKIIKVLVARTRPYIAVEGLNRIIEAQSEASFPSGHTSSSFAAAVVIYCMCPKKIGIPALVLAALISVSRIYVGVHYTTDVLAGALVGTAIALVVCKIYQRER